MIFPTNTKSPTAKIEARRGATCPNIHNKYAPPNKQIAAKIAFIKSALFRVVRNFKLLCVLLLFTYRSP